jgi:hypothetical protein
MKVPKTAELMTFEVPQKRCNPDQQARSGKTFFSLLSRISQMTSHTLAHELRQTFKNKVFDAFDTKVTGEPDG